MALIESSAANAKPALYALYNPGKATGRVADPGCPTGVPRGGDGITVVDAHTALRLVEKRGTGGATRTSVPLTEVALHAVPWSCLALCDFLGAHDPLADTNLASGWDVMDESDDLALAAAHAVYMLRRFESWSALIDQGANVDQAALLVGLAGEARNYALQSLKGDLPQALSVALVQAGEQSDADDRASLDADEFGGDSAPAFVAVLPRDPGRG